MGEVPLKYGLAPCPPTEVVTEQELERARTLHKYLADKKQRPPGTLQ